MPQIKINGMIDPHTHLRDLDWSHKATFSSETKAAIAGGYWAVFDMPNTAPSTVDDALLTDKLERIDRGRALRLGALFRRLASGQQRRIRNDRVTRLRA